MGRAEPTGEALLIIDKLKQDGFYKGFTLIDIKSVVLSKSPRAAARSFAEKWAAKGIKTERIGWRWLGVPQESPSLIVAYRGALSPRAAFQMCKYVFGGKIS